MFFVEARYHRNPDKVPQQIRYISHREERLPSGERRELFGIGDRYRALRGDEKAVEKAHLATTPMTKRSTSRDESPGPAAAKASPEES